MSLTQEEKKAVADAARAGKLIYSGTDYHVDRVP